MLKKAILLLSDSHERHEAHALSPALCAPGDLDCFFQGIAEVLPSVEAALKRPHALDPELLKLQRHTGAGGFVGSSAVEDNFLVERQSACAFSHLFRQHTNGAGQHARVADRVESVAQVNDDDPLARIEQFAQFLRCDA